MRFSNLGPHDSEGLSSLRFDVSLLLPRLSTRSYDKRNARFHVGSMLVAAARRTIATPAAPSNKPG
jgi:hypothetical protein